MRIELRSNSKSHSHAVTSQSLFIEALHSGHHTYLFIGILSPEEHLFWHHAEHFTLGWPCRTTMISCRTLGKRSKLYYSCWQPQLNGQVRLRVRRLRWGRLWRHRYRKQILQRETDQGRQPRRSYRWVLRRTSTGTRQGWLVGYARGFFMTQILTID